MAHFSNAFDPTNRGAFSGLPQPFPQDGSFSRRRRAFDPTAIGAPLPPLLGGGGSRINPRGGIGNLPGNQFSGQFGSFDPNTSPIFGGNEFAEEALGAEPRTSFFSSVNQLRNPQRRFFSNRFDPIQNEFLGLIGSQLQGGTVPDLTFDRFIRDFDFNRRFRSTAPSLRGQGDRTRFAPPTRFLG